MQLKQTCSFPSRTHSLNIHSLKGHRLADIATKCRSLLLLHFLSTFLQESKQNQINSAVTCKVVWFPWIRCSLKKWYILFVQTATQMFSSITSHILDQEAESSQSITRFLVFFYSYSHIHYIPKQKKTGLTKTTKSRMLKMLGFFWGFFCIHVSQLAKQWVQKKI